MSEWISVDDRLPEENQPIIVFGKDGNELCSGYNKMNFSNYYSEVKFWQPQPDSPS